MRRSRVVVLFASAVAFATACNALTGASDLTADLCTDCGDDASVIPTDAPVDTSKPESAETGVDGGKHPTFCLGLVLYATYDTDTTSTVGTSLLAGSKDTVIDDGKFGKGLQVSGESSSAYYAFTDGGYPDEAGTLAMWFKPVDERDASADRILVKPILDMSNTVNETAPEVRFENGGTVLGIMNQDDKGTFVTAGVTAQGNDPLPGFDAGAFNHLVGTWNASTPSLQFWLNGGTVAGTYVVNKSPWTTQATPTGYLRFSSSVTPANGVFDELALWSRELGMNEVQALYASPVSIKDACGL